MLRVVEKPSKENEELRETLDAVLQRGALKRLQEMLESEVEDYSTRHRAARDERGRAQVVRNGTAPARQLVTGSGTLEVRAPRVNDRRVDAQGQRQRFSSELLPSYMRRAPKVTEVLPMIGTRPLRTSARARHLRVSGAEVDVDAPAGRRQGRRDHNCRAETGRHGPPRIER